VRRCLTPGPQGNRDIRRPQAEGCRWGKSRRGGHLR